jgi:hypothetical protein
MRMTRMVCVVCCTFSLAAGVFSQTRSGEPLTQSSATPLYQHPVVVARPYQQTWYDVLLRQFNPDNLDWGRWLEQRRENLLEQTAANPYFKYSLVTTTLLMLFAIALAKSEIDKSRIKWLAQDRHEDLLRQDRYSRRVAHDSIRKYNAHMEKCNRIVETETVGRFGAGPSSPPAQGAMTLDQSVAENAQLRREREQLRAELDSTKAIVGDLTMRVNGMSGGNNGSPQAGRAQGDLVKQLNELREQLYRERERNKQLKGM